MRRYLQIIYPIKGQYPKYIKNSCRRELQDGGKVRCGDHLPPHKYIRNTSTCWTTPTEHLLYAGRRPQTSQKARISPCTWVGQKKKEKTETKELGQDLHQWEGAVKGERFPHIRKPLHRQRLQVEEGGSFGAMAESTATGVRRAKRRDSRTEDRCRPALTSPRGLSAHPLGWVGARSWDSGFRGRISGRGLGLAVWTQPEGG